MEYKLSCSFAPGTCHECLIYILYSIKYYIIAVIELWNSCYPIVGASLYHSLGNHESKHTHIFRVAVTTISRQLHIAFNNIQINRLRTETSGRQSRLFTAEKLQNARYECYRLSLYSAAPCLLYYIIIHGRPSQGFSIFLKLPSCTGVKYFQTFP